MIKICTLLYTGESVVCTGVTLFLIGFISYFCLSFHLSLLPLTSASHFYLSLIVLPLFVLSLFCALPLSDFFLVALCNRRRALFIRLPDLPTTLLPSLDNHEILISGDVLFQLPIARMSDNIPYCESHLVIQ